MYRLGQIGNYDLNEVTLDAGIKYIENYREDKREEAKAIKEQMQKNKGR
jgi:hypothetical protein